MFAWLCPAMFAQHQTLHSVWGTLEWIGNTIVFLLAGLLITTRALVNIKPHDFANLFVLYIVVHVIRAVMLAAFFPVVANIGKGCAVNEGVFIWFSGLRGAIAIALVLSIVQRQHFGRTTISDNDIEALLFYVGGFSCLTLLVNATAAGKLLEWLKIGRRDVSVQEEIQIRHYARKRIIASGIEMMTELPEKHAVMVAQTCHLLSYNGPAAAEAPSPMSQHSFRARSDHGNSFDVEESEMATNREDGSLNKLSDSKYNELALGDYADTNRLASFSTPERTRTAAAITPSEYTPFDYVAFEMESPEQIGANLARSAYQRQTVPDTDVVIEPSFKRSPMGTDRRRSTTFVTNEAMLTYIRDCFLHVVRTYYWKCVHTGRVSRHSVALQLLLSSVEVGLETIHTPGLQDWDFIQSIRSHSDSWFSRFYLGMPKFAQTASSSIMSRLLYTDDVVVSVLTCFISAHEYAQQRIPVYLGEEAVADTVEQAVVVAESQKLVQKAKSRLNGEFDAEHIQLLKSQQIVYSIQHHQEVHLTQMVEEGILKEHDAVSLFDELHADRDLAAKGFRKALDIHLRSKFQ
jgi:hypothetical protein